jgi:hypothetical protein
MEGFGIVRRGCGCKRRGRQFRFFVTRLADITLHFILVCAAIRLRIFATNVGGEIRYLFRSGGPELKSSGIEANLVYIV